MPSVGFIATVVDVGLSSPSPPRSGVRVCRECTSRCAAAHRAPRNVRRYHQPVIEARRITEDQWPAYRELRLDALRQDPTAFGSSYEEEAQLNEEEWKKRTRTALCAFSGSDMIGMTTYLRISQQKNRHLAYIFAVYVKPSHRGQGVARQLIEKALADIQAMPGVVKVKLTVTESQRAAVALYKRFGFRVTGTLKQELCVEGRFYDQLAMEKHLRPQRRLAVWRRRFRKLLPF